MKMFAMVIGGSLAATVAFGPANSAVPGSPLGQQIVAIGPIPDAADPKVRTETTKQGGALAGIALERNYDASAKARRAANLNLNANSIPVNPPPR